MGDWLAEYSSALRVRDSHEQAHKPFIDACMLAWVPPHLANLPDTRLADRANPAPQGGPETPSKGSKDDLSTLRADLASTQKARATLTSTLKDVEAQLSQLQTERKESLSQITALTKTKLDVERKLRDRDEELRGKAGLVERAQDEMVSLQLELSMAEDKADRLTKENKELVDRWMKRMAEEADKVNRDSKWT